VRRRSSRKWLFMNIGRVSGSSAAGSAITATTNCNPRLAHIAATGIFQ